MKRRVAQLPLHGGRAPPWLFRRMTKLAGAVTMAVVEDYGPGEMLSRLADPWWFQAFGCALGFDWHSSGVTTVTCGAMKEAAKLYGDDFGILVAGGKGGASRKTPREIEAAAGRRSIPGGEKLIHASRMSAKVDSAAVQDGYQVYHHSFFFTDEGGWCVVQQGMNDSLGRARRYHWLGESVDDFVCEPHKGIRDLSPPAAAGRGVIRLNMVAAEAEGNRTACCTLVREDPDRLAAEALRLTEGPTLFAPAHHAVRPSDVNAEHLRRVLRRVHESEVRDFETLLGSAGVGPAAVRSLSLLAEIIHDAPASRRDVADRKWADYSYAHGGKDGHPFPVDRDTYDQNIALLQDAIRRARAGDRERTDALRRLARHTARA